MAKQKKYRKKISLELDGEVYNGYRIITGEAKPRQKIYFTNESIQDKFTYESWKFKNPGKMMEIRAKQLLRELVFRHLEQCN